MKSVIQQLDNRILRGDPISDITSNAHWAKGTAFEFISKLPDLNFEEFCQRVLEINNAGATRRLLYLYFGGRKHGTVDDCVQLQRRIQHQTAADELASDLMHIFSLGAAIQSGQAQQHLIPGSTLARVASAGDPWSTLVHGMAHSNMGRAYQHLGNFRLAHEHFSAAQESGVHLPWTTYFFDLRLAGLYWASGQPNRSLAIYLANEFQEAMSRQSVVRRVSVHLSIAKCAIDTKDAALAQQELCKAVELLPQTGRKDLDAYATLYAGELSVLKERYGEGRELLMGAAASFDALDPPHFVGMLDAKIALAHFAFYDNDRALAFLIMRKLLDEAEELNCFHARSRLLVLETCLFVSDNPPLKQAYDDLITRVHLINNPALLFQALGNLYTYSLGFLSDRDSAYMLQRIRNLEGVIEKSCFEDLYRAYITERYEYAIENRLARLADAEGDGHDFDAPETDIDNNPEVEFE